MAFDFYSAEPPPEVKKFLFWHRLPRGSFQGWYDVPSLNPPGKRLSQEQLQKNQIDIFDTLGDLLYHPILNGAFRTLDLLVGCGKQCPVCLARAAFPSSMFSYSSLAKAFTSNLFLSKWQPNYLRVGVTGDTLDHPYGPEIMQLMIAGTKILDEKCQKKNKKEHHLVHAFANFRPSQSDRMDDLIRLAVANPDRFHLCLSLPVMKDDALQNMFRQYALSRQDFFSFGKKIIFSGLHNMSVQNVPEGVIWKQGRYLDEDSLPADLKYYTSNRRFEYQHRGQVEVYVNPEAVWLKIQETVHESSTGWVFTPLNMDNIGIFSRLPYYSRYPAPVNWPGGQGKDRSIKEADELVEKNKFKPIKAFDVVK